MTLNIAVVTPWGAWLCADHRITQHGVPVDNFSIKHVAVTSSDGSALITYCGLGKLDDGVTPISDWLRRELRGESRTIDQTMHFIRERANTVLIPMLGGGVHVFTVAAFIRGHAHLLQITNAHLGPDWLNRPGRSEFDYTGRATGRDVAVIGLGSGARSISQAQLQAVKRLACKRRRTPERCSRLRLPSCGSIAPPTIRIRSE